MRFRSWLTPLALGVAFSALPLGALAQATPPKLKDVLGDVEAGQEAVPGVPSGTSAPPVVAAPAPPPAPPDPLGRGLPRGAVMGFFEAADMGDLETAKAYLDTRNLPSSMESADVGELARELRVVLDRALWIDPASLSTHPKGHTDDGQPSYRDLLGVVETPEGGVPILLQRVPRREDGVQIWKFSNRTVKEIPRLYEVYGYSPFVDGLARSIPEGRFLGFDSWQWVGMTILGLAFFALAYVLTAIPAWLLRRRGGRRGAQIAPLLTRPVRALVFLLAFREGVELLAPSLAIRAVLSANTLVTIVVAWLALRVSDIALDLMRQRLERQGNQVAVFVPPLATLAQIVIVIVAVIVWLQNLGFNVAALLAGLGIGGIALALASQKSIEDVFGAVTLYSSQPVKVGDFCRFGSTLGTVEEIGLRSTRVRTLDDTVLSISNASFAQERIENFTRRRKMLYRPRIQLRHDTSPEQIRVILARIRELLSAHPKIVPVPARARFLEFGEHSLEIEAFAYVNTTDYDEFLGVAEELNLQIMQVVAEAGAEMAIPARLNFVQKGFPVDEESAQEAVRTRS